MNGIMIVLLLGTSIGGLIAYKVSPPLKGRGEWWEIFFGAVMGLIITTIFGGLAYMMFSLEEGRVTPEKIASGYCTEFKTEKPIISISREKQSSGSFILGTGTVSSRVYYFSYVQSDDGLMLKKYPRHKTYIVEQTGPPKIVTTNYTCPTPVVSWAKGKELVTHNYSYKFQIYVPINTILREFKL